MILKAVLNKQQSKQLSGTRLTSKHYSTLVTDPAVYTDEQNQTIAVFLRDVIPAQLQKQVEAPLMTVNGSLSNRGSVIGKGSLMPRIRKDGTVITTACRAG